MKEKKEKPLVFRMRVYNKSSQKTSFSHICNNLTLLQHFIRSYCIKERKENDISVNLYQENYKNYYIKNHKIKPQDFSLDLLTEIERKTYWENYYKIYKKIVHRTTDLNYLYVLFKENNPDIEHSHSDIYQSFCQQFAVVFSNYENKYTKLPRKSNTIVTIPFKGTSFGLFKSDMPKKYYTEYDNLTQKLNSTKRKIIYLNGIGLVEYVYHKKDFDLTQVSTVKLTMSKTGKFYIDFCYDFKREPVAMSNFNTITQVTHKIDMTKDFTGYDWGMGKYNWLTSSKDSNINFDPECSMHSKEVITVQKQLDKYKTQYKNLLINLFSQSFLNKGFSLELIKYEYPKRTKENNFDKYGELEPVKRIININNIELLEKELKNIQKHSELDKLFKQLISYVAKEQRKSLYQNCSQIVSKIKKKERALSLVWEKIGFKRKDLVCKTAIEIVSQDAKYIVFEELNTSNMMDNFNFKSLRKTLGNAIYRDLIERTMLKAYKIGKIVLTIDPKYTSMDCSECGNRKFDLKLSDRIYNCVKCGYQEDRDINAAKNIEYKGILQILYHYGLTSFNDSKLYKHKYKELYKSVVSSMTDGQVSQVS